MAYTDYMTQSPIMQDFAELQATGFTSLPEDLRKQVIAAYNMGDIGTAMNLISGYGSKQAEATKNQLLTAISSMAGQTGGTMSAVNLADLQNTAFWPEFVKQAQAAGLDPVQLVNERNQNVGTYNTGGSASQIGQWFDRTGLGDAITLGTIAVAGLGAAGGFGVGPFGGGAGAGTAGAAGTAGELAPITLPAGVSPISATAAMPGFIGGTGAAQIGVGTTGALGALGGAAGAGLATAPNGMLTAANPSVVAPAAGVGGAAAGIDSGVGAGLVGPAAGLSGVATTAANVANTATNAANTANNATNAANTANNAVTGAGGTFLDALKEWAPLISQAVGSYLQYQSAGKSTEAQVEAANKAIGYQDTAKTEALGYLQPYQQAGLTALDQMKAMTTPGSGYDITTDPSYGFVRDQAIKTLESSAAARGGLLSGNFATSALELAGKYASTEYQNIYNRLNQIVNYGINAAGNASNIATNYAANVGNLLTGQGEARASGYTAQGNTLADLAAGVGTAVGSNKDRFPSTTIVIPR